jgi:cell division protein FtsB
MGTQGTVSSLHNWRHSEPSARWALGGPESVLWKRPAHDLPLALWTELDLLVCCATWVYRRYIWGSRRAAAARSSTYSWPDTAGLCSPQLRDYRSWPCVDLTVYRNADMMMAGYGLEQSVEKWSCQNAEVWMMKNRERRLPLPPMDIITVLVCTAAIFFILALGGKALEGYRLRRHNAILSAQVAELRKEQAELEERLDYVKSPGYAEQVAREEYRWVGPGETLVIPIFRRRPVEVAPTTSSEPTGETMDSQSTSYWPAWWRLLSGAFD